MDHNMDQDDVMLSSAEDLNNEMDFGMADSVQEPPRDPEVVEPELAELEQQVDEVEHIEEPENESGSDSATHLEAQPNPDSPTPEASKPTAETHHRHHSHPIAEFHHPEPHPHTAESAPHRHSDRCSVCKPNYNSNCKPTCQPACHESGIVSVEPCKINKLALIWMIILTIILAGVIGIMAYAFIVQNTSQTSDSTPAVVTEHGSSIAIAGALEVYLNDIDLNNYDSDLLLVNNGGVIHITGSLTHTIYINATAATTINLDNVDISTTGPAIVNLGDAKLTLDATGTNRLSASGTNKYSAVIFSDSFLEITGSGSLSISALEAGVKSIATTEGYNLNGSNLIALSRADNETPLESSEQGYISKSLPGTVYTAGTPITISDSNKDYVVAEAISDCDFSSILISNPEIKNDTMYSIDLGTKDTKNTKDSEDKTTGDAADEAAIEDTEEADE